MAKGDLGTGNGAEPGTGGGAIGGDWATVQDLGVRFQALRLRSGRQGFGDVGGVGMVCVGGSWIPAFAGMTGLVE